MTTTASDRQANGRHRRRARHRAPIGTARPRPPVRRWAVIATVAAVAVLFGASCTETPGDGANTNTTPSEVAPTTGATSGAADPVSPGTGPVPALPELSSVERDYAEALGEVAPPGGFDAADTNCLASRWVSIIGVDALAAAGVTPEAIATGEKSLPDVTLDEATAHAMVDAFGPCDIDLVEYLLASMRTGVVNEAEYDCLEARLTDELARSFLVAGLRDTTDAPMQAAFDGCRPDEPFRPTSLVAPSGTEG